jgi:hypothetical protein
MLKPLNETKFKFWIVDPVESINHVENPLPWTLEGYEKMYSGGSLEVRTEHMRNGGPCLRAINTGIKYTKPMTELEAGEQYELLVDAYAVKDTILTVHIVKHNSPAIETKSFRMGGNWQWLRIPFIGVHGVTFEIEIADQEGDIVDNTFWIDRLSVQKGTNMTWFCGYGFGGDSSLHFRWEGEPMNSRSIHNGQDRRAGKMYDLDDYMEVKQVLGLGMGDWEQRMTPVLTGGALYQDMLELPRPFSIVGVNKANKMKDLMLKRKQLSLLLRPDGNDHSPINLLFQAINKVTGYPESEEVTIECVCTTALKNMPDVDTVADSTLTFMKPDPYLYGNYYNGYRQGQDIEITSDNIIMRKANGEWKALPGLDGMVLAVAFDSSGRIWAGGSFTGKIRMWDGSTWVRPPGTNADPNEEVRAITCLPNGEVYIGGVFTQIGTANIPKIARYKKDTNNNWDWHTLKTGENIEGNAVNCIYPDQLGQIVVGGDFTTVAGQTSKSIALFIPHANDNTGEWRTYGSAINSGAILSICDGGLPHRIAIAGQFDVGSSNPEFMNMAFLLTDSGHMMSIGDVRTYPKSFFVANKIIKLNDSSLAYVGRFDFKNQDGEVIASGVGRYKSTRNTPFTTGLKTLSYGAGVQFIYQFADGTIDIFTDRFKFTYNDQDLGRFLRFEGGVWKRHPDANILEDSIGEELKIMTAAHTIYGDVVYAGMWSGTIKLPAPPDVIPMVSEATAGTYPIIRVFGTNRIRSAYNKRTGKTIQFKGALIPEKAWFEMILKPDNVRVMVDWKNRLDLVNVGSSLTSFVLEPGRNDIVIDTKPYVTDPKPNGDVYVLWKPRFWGIEGAFRNDTV